MANIVPYSSPGIAATSRWRSLSSVAGGYAVIGGTITLIGWALNVRRLTDWNNDGISMFANAAACAVLSGLALLALNGPAWPRRQFAIRVAGCCVAVLGGLTLLQHVSGYNLEIDQLLANRPWGQRAATSPMRMGPPASTSFLILGAGLLLATSNSRARRLASNLAILPIAISSLSLIGYWYGADRLFGVARFTGIAWQTSTMVAALALGLIAAVPEHGLAAVLRRDDPGASWCAGFSCRLC